MISTWFSTWIILVGHFQPIFGSILFVFRSRLRRLWFELKWFKNKRSWSIFPHRCSSLKIFSIIGPSRCINEVLEKWHVCRYWHVVTKKEVMLYIDQHSQKIEQRNRLRFWTKCEYCNSIDLFYSCIQLHWAYDTKYTGKRDKWYVDKYTISRTMPFNL